MFLSSMLVSRSINNIDYRLRVYRRPHKRMRQVVVYLQPTTSDLVQQTTFTVEGTLHEFELIQLWEQPTAHLFTPPTSPKTVTKLLESHELL